jgi:hypothetical protein
MVELPALIVCLSVQDVVIGLTYLAFRIEGEESPSEISSAALAVHHTGLQTHRVVRLRLVDNSSNSME